MPESVNRPTYFPLPKTYATVLKTRMRAGSDGDSMDDFRIIYRLFKAIIAYEPGGTPFIFPENEMPKITEARFKALSASAIGVPIEDFLKLTKIPIVLYYGDYIQVGSENVGEDKWGTEFAMAEQFVAAINRHGGDATLVHLPKIGIRGNSHFLMQERNNQQIMELALTWLHEKGLDK